MSSNALADAGLTPTLMQMIKEKLVGSYPRVLAEHPEAVVQRGLSLQSAMQNDGDVEGELKKFLTIDGEWRKLGVEVGLLEPEDGGPEVACGGACIFLAGMAVGMLAEKLL